MKTANQIEITPGDPSRRGLTPRTALPLLAVLIGAGTLLAAITYAQSAKEIRGATPYAAIANEPPPKLIVDPPLPDLLDKGIVWIQYRSENCRILPVFGKAALKLSPRVGHLHVRVDACDTCRAYIKTIDLTRNGLAVPEVDDLAAIPLTLWADEKGYNKVTCNFIGL